MSDIDTPRVAVEVRDSIGWITFSNPARRNAVTLDMWRSLPTVLDQLEAVPNVRVVVLRGAGESSFISGADISEFEEYRSALDAIARYDRIAGDAQTRLYNFAKPTVAMVRGACYGAGVSLAACCDVRLASDQARFAIPAAKLGLGYRAAGIKKLIDLIGPARTLDLFYSAEAITAARAYEIGLVEHVVPDETLHDFVVRYCGRIARNAPLTLRAAKTAAREIARAADNYDQELCNRLVQGCFVSEDYAEGRRAFREKRTPKFRGC
ncbi:MAG TPA: enoyl-CoA hydratase [Xanthobacteraceae bacterium]|nr:enoyl-CoA hydratase [Xanthobacteraceae bacterium]